MTGRTKVKGLTEGEIIPRRDTDLHLERRGDRFIVDFILCLRRLAHYMSITNEMRMEWQRMMTRTRAMDAHLKDVFFSGISADIISASVDIADFASAPSTSSRMIQFGLPCIASFDEIPVRVLDCIALITRSFRALADRSSEALTSIGPMRAFASNSKKISTELIEINEKLFEFNQYMTDY